MLVSYQKHAPIFASHPLCTLLFNLKMGKKRFLLHRICDPQIFQVNVAFDGQWEQENRFCSFLKKLDRGTA
jgi:hypothetical protein